MWSQKYQLLDILEVAYNNSNEKINRISENAISSIYLSYDKKLTMIVINSWENEIKSIINKCINLHNEKQEIHVENIGKKKRKKGENELENEYQSDFKIRKYDRNDIAKMRYFLNRKINILNDDVNLCQNNLKQHQTT